MSKRKSNSKVTTQMFHPPTNKQMADDKKTAYEQAQIEQKQDARQRQMQDLASMFGDETEPVVPIDEEPQRSYGGARR